MQLAIGRKERRVLRDSIPKYHAPNMKEIEKVRRLPPGSDVLAYREKSAWQGYKLSSVEDSTVNVILPSRKISTFGMNCVRQLNEDVEKERGIALFFLARRMLFKMISTKIMYRHLCRETSPVKIIMIHERRKFPTCKNYN